MDIEKRTKCAEILKLSVEQCTELLAKKLFENKLNIKKLAMAAICGNALVESAKVHLIKILDELSLLKPTLTVTCLYYSNFNTPNSFCKNHSYVKERRKDDPTYLLNMPEYKIFIQLFKSEYILLDLDQLTYEEQQCIQILLKDSFSIINNTIHCDIVTYTCFEHNEILAKYYNPRIVIKEIIAIVYFTTGDFQTLNELLSVYDQKNIIKETWRDFVILLSARSTVNESGVIIKT
jgi:hypothetical protein